MKIFFHYLFLPHEQNNYRAKLLHHKSLLLTIAILLALAFFLSILKSSFPSVLGTSVDISSEKLILLTNKEREKDGVTPLILNAQLSEAALKKAENMFEQNYWAHNSPDGKTPWIFIKSAGYNYTYAGENLAKGFSDSKEVIDAWMASPQHRTNILSRNYRDVGFAVKAGRLNGEETVLVVEEFGDLGLGPVAVAQNIPNRQDVTSQTTFNKRVVGPNVFGFSINRKSLINSLSLSSNLDRIIAMVFIFALILDMVVVERKRIIRFFSHNIDHIFFLLMIFLIIGILGKGVVI